jgi:hypothetical protein
MFIANILHVLCRRQFAKFQKSLHNPHQAQSILQQTLFHSLLKSPYGKSLRLIAWKDIPIVNYTDLAPWIETGGLTSAPIKHYVQTSGSTNTSKQIPYTHGLQKSFINLFKIWAYDLLTHSLKPQTGKIFMSLSPPTATGLKDDSQYLSRLLRVLLKPFLIFPPQDPALFQDRLAKSLLLEENLEIISVWNPSYLTILLHHIEEHRDDFLPFCSGKRRKCLERIQPHWTGIWPKLQLISCWTAGWARAQAQALQSLFPDVLIQGKGLLATEAPMTVPLHGAPAPVPLLDEVFFEFEDDAGNIFLMDEIQAGENYQIIISQQGGLYRYRIGDRVRMAGRYKAAPCLDFLGRAGPVCDMAGEKLDAVIVEKALNETFGESLATKILLPVYDPGHKSHYLLLTDTMMKSLADKTEQALQQCYHYRAARFTGQLDPIAVIHQSKLLEALHRFYAKEGLNLGDIKDPVWIADPGQAAAFLQFIEK